MQFYYQHERDERHEQPPINLVWPLMATDGISNTLVRNYMADRDLDFNLAEVNGWYPSRSAGDCFLRIVIPAVTTKARHIYWQARAIDPQARIRYQSPKGPREGALIYVNGMPTDACGYVTNKSNRVVVVEGPMDALAAAMCGYDAVALMGINPGIKALEHLNKLIAKRDTLVLLDSEPEATIAAHTVCMSLASTGTNARCATLQKRKDLAACSREYRQTFLDEHLGDF